MSTITTNLLNSLQNKIEEVAQQYGIFFNQFVASAAVEKSSAFLTVAWLRQRVQRSRQEVFEQALTKIPDIEPKDYEKL